MEAGPRTGRHFGAYKLLGELGRGGMGVVYRAEHQHLQRVVALKLLTPDLADSSGFRERFQRESRLAASLDHPNVVPVYDAGDIGGTLYLAMRFIDGTDLATVLEREGRLAPERAVEVLEQVGAALDAAHARDLVHRDVKPANVMIDSERCYLTDFGLTKRFSAETTALTAAGQFLGTVDYVAPEQIEGRPLDGRADVYSLGCVLYECLTGSRPYPRPAEVAVLYAQLREPPPRPSTARPELPPGIDAVVAQAMAKRPEDRFPTCADLVGAARAALAAPPTVPRAVPPPAPAPPLSPATREAPGAAGVQRYARRARGWAVAAGAAGVAAAAVVAALALAGGDDDGPAPADEASQPRVAGPPIPVGTRPFGVVAAGGDLWIANNSDDTLTRVSPDGEESTTIPVGDGPFGVASTGETIWVANSRDGTADRIDAETGEKRPEVTVGESSFFVAAGPRRAFVSNGGSDTISEFYVPSGEPRRPPFATGPEPRGVAIADGSVWVANRGDGTVWRIEHGRRTHTIEVGANPVGVAAGDDAIWVANEEDDTVSRIEVADPSAPARTVPVGDAPFEVAVGEGFVWVANSGDDTVMRLDPESGEQVGEPVDVPGQPVGVAVAEGSVWVTANDRNALVRIEP